jgi:hypothetical protein
VERLDGAFMGILEARRGRFLVAGDLLWARLEQDEDANLGTLASGVRLTTENTMATGVIGYTVIQRPEAILDIIAGARYWSVDNELAFRGGTLGGESFSDSEDWVDPLAGISGRRDFAAKTYFTGWAVVGGFRNGSDSMWDVMAALGYRFNDRFSGVAGYRALSVDYENDGFLYDVEQSGIMLGANYAF